MGNTRRNFIRWAIAVSGVSSLGSLAKLNVSPALDKTKIDGTKDEIAQKIIAVTPTNKTFGDVANKYDQGSNKYIKTPADESFFSSLLNKKENMKKEAEESLSIFLQNKFTHSELSSILKFFESPEGRKYSDFIYEFVTKDFYKISKKHFGSKDS